MNDCLYSMIFKRKSFHVFKEYIPLSPQELQNIKKAFLKCQALFLDIKVKMEIVPKEQTSCRRGEYCLLLYSERKENAFKNIGYIGEQMDLWLASQNIGVCWYGAGKTSYQKSGLEFVIMLAIQKVPENQFRKDMFRSRRKRIDDIWQGESYQNIADIVRFAPSACNLQAWFVQSSPKELLVYQELKTKRGIMPVHKVYDYHQISMGIFLCFLELCLHHEKLSFQRTLYLENTIDHHRQRCARYLIL